MQETSRESDMVSTVTMLSRRKDNAGTGDDSRHKWMIPFLLLLAVLLGVFVRTASFQNFINPEGGFFFWNVDSYDHLRRVTLGVHSFPSIPSFDSYAGYPRGTGQIWSPLYDYILSAVSFLLGGSRVTIETVCFFANPFYTVLTLLLIFFVAKRAFSSDAAGVAAAFFLALNPGHISSSIPMNFGHHVFEAMAILLLFGVAFFEKGDRLPLRGRLVTMFFLVLSIFMWRGCTIYWGIAFLAVLIRCVLLHNRKLSLDYSAAFAGASVILAAYCAVNPWGSAGNFNFGVISWFHVVVLVLFSIALVLYGRLRERKTFFYLMAGLGLATVVALFLPPVRRFFSEIATGITFLRGGGDPWLESNSEMKGTFSQYGVLFSASYLSAVWFAAPVAAVVALLQWRRGQKTDKYLITLAIWSPAVLFGLVIRYTPIAGVIASLSGGYLFSFAWQHWQGKRQRAASIALMAVLLIPSYPHYLLTLTNDLPPHTKYALLGSRGVLEWIKNNTPKTSYYLDPYKQPEYGVLASWDLGAKIYQIAERPAMSTAFGWETHGFYEQNGFMVTSNQEIARTIARQNGIRYLLLNAFIKFESLRAIALDGEKKGRLLPGTTGRGDPEQSIYERLMYHDGSAYGTPHGFVPALNNYRLVFETDYLGESPIRGTVNYYKVFEVVPGATISGKAIANSKVFISLPLVTSAKRVMYFQDATTADDNGNFAFTVPYATETLQGVTVPFGSYIVLGGVNKEHKVSVTERDIREARTIRLPW